LRRADASLPGHALELPAVSHCGVTNTKRKALRMSSTSAANTRVAQLLPVTDQRTVTTKTDGVLNIKLMVTLRWSLNDANIIVVASFQSLG
jgi:hypothetical protein